jgi:hypothetical protein
MGYALSPTSRQWNNYSGRLELRKPERLREARCRWLSDLSGLSGESHATSETE